jgi:hypothetical protein
LPEGSAKLMGIANLTGKSEKSPVYLLNTKGNMGTQITYLLNW